MSVISFLSSGNYLTVNKDVAFALGLDEAIILGELASEYEYWFEQEKLENGFFFSTQENIFKNTTLTAHRQRNALKNLENYGIVEVERRGLPAKRYIKLNEEKIIEVVNNKLLKILTTGCQKFEQLDVKNFNSNKNKPNKNNIKKINENIYKSEFAQLWEIYPRKQGKEDAFKKYIKARSNGTTFEEVKQGLMDYLAYIKSQNIEGKFIKMGSTWFNQKSWEDDNSMRVVDRNDWLKELEL